jgi:putative oxidoreductase
MLVREAVMERVLGRFSPQFYAVMRIVVGLLFACHGAQKLFGVLGGQHVALASKFGVAGIIEFIGGLMVAIGFLTGTAAFVASGEMAYAYFTQHMPRGGLPIQNAGEPAVLFCFVFLYIAARGVGIWGVDKRSRI